MRKLHIEEARLFSTRICAQDSPPSGYLFLAWARRLSPELEPSIFGEHNLPQANALPSNCRDW